MTREIAILGAAWLTLMTGTLAVQWWTDDRGRGILWGQLISSPLWAPVVGIVYLLLLAGLLMFAAAVNAADLLGLTDVLSARPVRVVPKGLPWWKRPAIPPRGSRRADFAPR